jgi:hypothetical protein
MLDEHAVDAARQHHDLDLVSLAGEFLEQVSDLRK